MADPDRGRPEDRPDIFRPARCAACERCHIDTRVMRCSCGGPFNARLEVDRSVLVLL